MQSGHPAVDSCLVEGKVWKEQAKNLILISLYETRFRRAVEKDMAELHALQEKRKASYSRAQDEAIRLLQLALSQGKTTTPVTISSPPRPTVSSFFRPPNCSA